MSRYGYGEGAVGGRYNGLQSVGSAPTRPFDRYGSSGGMQVRLVHPLEWFGVTEVILARLFKPKQA